MVANESIALRNLAVDGGEIGVEAHIDEQVIALNIDAVDRAWVRLTKVEAQGLVNRLEEAIAILGWREADDE